MNFTSTDRLTELAKAHGFKSGAAEDAAAKFDAILLRLTSTAIAMAEVVAGTKSLKGAHFATLCKVARMLGKGLPALQKGGDPTGMPSSYYTGAPDSANYGADSMEGGYAFGTALHADAVFPGTELKVGGDGGYVNSPAYYGDVDAAYTQSTPSGHDQLPALGFARDGLASTFVPQTGGGPGCECMTKAAFDRVLAECKSRKSCDVKLDESAKRALRTIVDANADAILVLTRETTKLKTLTGAALAKCEAKWTLVL
jgi:hypothetical protein